MKVPVSPNLHNDVWRLYENDVDQHDREHLLTKFRRPHQQYRRARPYTLFMLPSLRRLSYIHCFHNELWGLYENEIARRGRKGVVCEFHVRDGQSRGTGAPTLLYPTFGLAGIQNVHNEPCGF
ncbi:predicted protein [Lichtheimia corymbifera JMRC:FSU:9682]|uniref:Uncharacterized protein n=1 Tax=Lichtheimia corymbifera JMRC:FSU:9682 TaxID=1263082 RepID=A0A068SHG0_9FUNG|nr:predicted protein [Lichtheimia corymbifera JMRC:FSU:9682]CDH61475.1 predicted protein [Lichtheimia corymbifera JMRC:FSU:9682]